MIEGLALSTLRRRPRVDSCRRIASFQSLRGLIQHRASSSAERCAPLDQCDPTCRALLRGVHSRRVGVGEERQALDPAEDRKPRMAPASAATHTGAQPESSTERPSSTPSTSPRPRSPRHRAKAECSPCGRASCARAWCYRDSEMFDERRRARCSPRPSSRPRRRRFAESTAGHVVVELTNIEQPMLTEIFSPSLPASSWVSPQIPSAACV